MQWSSRILIKNHSATVDTNGTYKLTFYKWQKTQKLVDAFSSIRIYISTLDPFLFQSSQTHTHTYAFTKGHLWNKLESTSDVMLKTMWENHLKSTSPSWYILLVRCCVCCCLPSAHILTLPLSIPTTWPKNKRVQIKSKCISVKLTKWLTFILQHLAIL